jgi:hypothetical protein
MSELQLFECHETRSISLNLLAIVKYRPWNGKIAQRQKNAFFSPIQDGQLQSNYRMVTNTPSMAAVW